MTKVFNYIIADIHGCFDDFLRLEEKIQEHALLNKALPFIISSGDLIDRGSDSYQLLKYFIDGEKNTTHKAIMGNHEVLMLQAIQCYKPDIIGDNFPNTLDTYESLYESNKGHFKNLSWEDFKTTVKSIWVGQGGYETLKSFGFNPEHLKTWDIAPEIISFLLNQSLFYEGDNFIVTHALSRHEDLKKVQDLINRKLNEKEKKELRLASNSLILNRVVPEEKIHDKIHISGHTPVNRIKRLKKINAIQIDTACVFGNKLTAYCPEVNKALYVKSGVDYLSYF